MKSLYKNFLDSEFSFKNCTKLAEIQALTNNELYTFNLVVGQAILLVLARNEDTRLDKFAHLYDLEQSVREKLKYDRNPRSEIAEKWNREDEEIFVNVKISTFCELIRNFEKNKIRKDLMNFILDKSASAIKLQHDHIAHILKEILEYKENEKK